MSEVVTEVREPRRLLVRMRLEISLVSVGELGDVAAVLQARYRMANDKRFLQRRIECAGENPVRDIVTWHYVELCLRIDTHDAQVACAEQRDETGVRSATVDPPRERSE